MGTIDTENYKRGEAGRGSRAEKLQIRYYADYLSDGFNCTPKPQHHPIFLCTKPEQVLSEFKIEVEIF